MKQFLGLVMAGVLMLAGWVSSVSANPYYSHSDGYPQTGAPATSAGMRGEFDLVAQGFNLLPTISGHANELVIVNGGGTALTTTNHTFSQAGNLVFAGPYSVTVTATGTTAITLPTAGVLATLGGVETLTNKTLTAPIINDGLLNRAVIGSYSTASLPATCTEGAVTLVNDGRKDGIQRCVSNSWVSVRTFNALEFGAKGDVILDKTCSISASSSLLTCSSAPFKSGDVGKTILVPKAGAGHSAPATLLVITRNTDSTSGQMTAGNHQYKFTCVNGNGETLASSATVAVTNDGTHTSNKITSANICGGAGNRGFMKWGIYRNSVAVPSIYRLLTYNCCGSDYYDVLPDAMLASEPLEPSSDTSASDLITTIAGYTSATVVTLTSGASTASTNQSFTKWGTDDTAALHSLNNALITGSAVYFPPGRYWHKVSPLYRVDVPAGDHNGIGDSVIQVKETIDSSYFTADNSVTFCHVSACSPAAIGIASIATTRFTLSSPLAYDLSEDDYVYDSTVGLFTQGLTTSAKNNIVWIGNNATLEWLPGSTGRVFAKTDADRMEVGWMNFVGQTRVSEPPGQMVFGTGDGAGSATNVKLHHLWVEKTWQFYFWGIHTNGWVVEDFVCYWVLACIQGGAGVGAVYEKHDHTINRFSIYADPLGTDDAIAIFADTRRVKISNGMIDKGGSSNQLWWDHYQGDSIDVAADVGGVIDDLEISNVIMRGSKSIQFSGGSPPEQAAGRFLNWNKLHILLLADTGGVVQNVRLTNISTDTGFYSMYLAGNVGGGRIKNVEMTNVQMRNCAYTCFDARYVDSLKIRNTSIKGHSLWQPAHGINLSNLTGLDFDGVEVDGTGSLANSNNLEVGSTLAGRVANLRLLNGVDGMRIYSGTFGDYGGPITFENLWAEGNSGYGYNFFNADQPKAVNGFYWRNNGGYNNTGGLYSTINNAIPSDGNAGTQATATLPNIGFGSYKVTCADPQGCLPTLSKTGAYDGLTTTVWNDGAYPLFWLTSSGVQHILGSSAVTGTNQSIMFKYVGDRWEEQGLTTEGARPNYCEIGAVTDTTTVEGFGSAATCTLKADATGGAFTINLPIITTYPDSTGNHGRVLTVVKTDSSANAVTLDANGTETISGALTLPLRTKGESVTIQGKSGSEWTVLSHSYAPGILNGTNTKTLTESSATGFVNITVPSETTTGGSVGYCIEANDGTNYQSRCGEIKWTAVNKAGTITCAVSTPDTATETVAVSSGTLTWAPTCTDTTNAVQLKANAVSSLTQTLLQINYRVVVTGNGSVISQ